MKMSQLKTLFIVVLVLANLFLLSLVAPRQVARSRQRDEVKQSIVSLLDKNGISMDKKAIPDDRDIGELEIKRNAKAQEMAAKAVLGSCEAEDMGGGITVYTSQKGSAVFRTGGEFTLTIEGSSEFTSAKHAHKLFRAMGIQVDKNSMETLPDSEGVRVSAYQCLEEVVVFDCPVIAQFGENGLEKVEGRWITQTQRASEGNASPCSAATAMTSFINAVRKEGIICANIEDLTQGYIISQTSSYASLMPAWQITTDTGIYMYNSSTGEVISLI